MIYLKTCERPYLISPRSELEAIGFAVLLHEKVKVQGGQWRTDRNNLLKFLRLSEHKYRRLQKRLVDLGILEVTKLVDPNNKQFRGLEIRIRAKDEI